MIKETNMYEETIKKVRQKQNSREKEWSMSLFILAFKDKLNGSNII